MNRSIYLLIALVLAAVAPARIAYAEDPPTKEQLENAKKAFGEGKALYDAGKLPEAADKFKESYRLSRNPVLLYNIGHTLDESGQKDKALFYYRKFLADAPKTAAQRKDVTKRVDEIEKENLEADLAGTTTSSGGTTPTKTPEPVKELVKLKPAGTYTATDFQHQLIEAAPPGKPLDVTAFVPEDSGFVVTLFYRGSGDTKFNAKPMKWRYKELVARIPGNKVFGSTIQYYIDVKDQTGASIAKSGKSTSPNLVNVEQGATPRFYPDLTEDSEPAVSPVQQKRRDEEDPLGEKGGVSSTPDPDPIVDGPVGEVGGGQQVDVARPNPKAKWIATGIAGGLLAGAVVTYILGAQQASNIEEDSKNRMGNTCMSPPCFNYDQYDIDVEKAGKRYNTFHALTMVTGVIATGVAGYFWYKERKAKKAHARSVTITPSVGPESAGVTAVGRF